MTGNKIDTVLIEALGLDAGEIIASLTTEDSAVDIRCAVAEPDASDGEVRAETLVIDTTDTKITGSGAVNLAKETLDLRLEPHAKDPSVFAAPTPIDINGTLKDPQGRSRQVIAGGPRPALRRASAPAVRSRARA